MAAIVSAMHFFTAHNATSRLCARIFFTTHNAMIAR
jgi:hypothetical protein